MTVDFYDVPVIFLPGFFAPNRYILKRNAFNILKQQKTELLITLSELFKYFLNKQNAF